MSDGLARLVLGPRHREVRAKWRARRGRAPGPWPGQAAPRPDGQALRPPPDPENTSNEDRAPEPSEQSPDLWAPVPEVPQEGWWPRTRRIAVLGAVGVVGLTGVASITGQVLDWTRPAPPPPASGISDIVYAGIARQAAVEFLSWDAAAPQARQESLATVSGGHPDTWNGSGQQWADTATVLSVRRGEDGRAVATVRTRVIPAAGQPVEQAAGPNQASPVPPQPAAAPGVPEPAQAARWLTVDVPLQQRGDQAVVTAPPALVGDTSGRVASPAVTSTEDSQDQAFANATEPVVTRLLQSYAASDLDYARASGAEVSGLDGAVQLDSVESWRAHPAGPDPSRRQGDATVTWSLPGGAELTSTYRIDLEKQQGRWYLAGVSAPSTPEVAS